MFRSIPLLRHRRDHHNYLVNQRGNDRLPHRRYKIQQFADMHQLNITSSQVIYWMTLMIVVIITTTTNTGVISVAGFQRPIQYQPPPPLLHNNIQTTNLPHNHHHNQSPLLLLRTSDTQRILTKSSIQTLHHIPQSHLSSVSRRSRTQLYFMGSDSGILGVGGPEVVRIFSVDTFENVLFSVSNIFDAPTNDI